MPACNPRAWMSLRRLTELWFLCLIVLYPFLIYGVLRWEQATTRRYISAVAAHDTRQLDTLFWMRRFAPGTRQVVSRWTTDFGGFPSLASCSSLRPVEMPGRDGMLDQRLWLLSPAIPMIRHRLEVQIGNDGKVEDARYDSHECYFTPTVDGGGSFTNQGLRFRFFIPIPVLVCMGIMSWLLAVASRAVGRRLVRRRCIPTEPIKNSDTCAP
jgi:hypothetical protein